MTHHDERRTLVVHIIYPFLHHVIKKSFFGEPHVLGVDVLKVEALVYLMGALLGRALRNKMGLLTALFFVPGTADSQVKKVAGLCKKDAGKHLKEFQSWGRDGPIKFDDVLFYRRVEALLAAAGVQMSPRDACEAYVRGDRKLRKLFDKKVGEQGFEERVRILLLEGAFFGSSFPESTQAMYQEAWANDKGFWAAMWPYGLVMPEEFKAATLKEAETMVLLVVADYVLREHPESFDDLDMANVIEEARSTVPVAASSFFLQHAQALQTPEGR